MHTVITPWTILAAAGVLLAFLIGFYTLIGRERKSPYLINSFFFHRLADGFGCCYRGDVNSSSIFAVRVALRRLDPSLCCLIANNLASV